MSDNPDGGPRSPAGDWLGTPHLSFKREPPFTICTLDRPQARNAMTPAMYFGIRYAVTRVNADPDLAGLLITGTVTCSRPAAIWARPVKTTGWKQGVASPEIADKEGIS